MLRMVWMYDWITKEDCKFAAHYVLFDKNGNILTLAQQDMSDMGPVEDGWYHSVLERTLEVDPSTNYNDLEADFDNSFGSCCAIYPAADAYEKTGYELPEKYQDVYGIVCITGLWDADTPKEQIPPDRSLNISY